MKNLEMAEVTTILSPADYFKWEIEQEERHEYENGKLIAMGGSSKEHNRLVRNLTTILWHHLGPLGRYELYPSKLRVKSGIDDEYYYPDLVLTEGEEHYLENAPDTLLNPLLLIEVLSESTAARDRGPKFEAYRSIGSLREYILVAQDKYQMEGFYQNDAGEWVIREPVAGLDNTFGFTMLDLKLELKEVYQGVEVL